MAKSYICTSCFSLKGKLIKDSIICRVCNHNEDVSKYKTMLQDSKDSLRYGYQYRVQYEDDLIRDPELRFRHHLIELHRYFEFVALAAISGITGNYAYDAIKNIINNLLENFVVIKLHDKQFKKILSDKVEQEKFIKYIQEYRDNKLNTDEKVIKAIEEEIRVHRAVDKFKKSSEYRELMALLKKLNKKRKRKGKK